MSHTLMKTRNAVFQLFLDRNVIKKSVKKSERRGLMGVGGFSRTTARRSLRKRAVGKVSPVGSPPFSHGPNHLLRNNIFFYYDDTEGSVITGPVKLNSSDTYIVPKIHEVGGIVHVRRNVNGQIKTFKMVYLPRPYMKKAQVKAGKKFPEMFRDSL